MPHRKSEPQLEVQYRVSADWPAELLREIEAEGGRVGDEVVLLSDGTIALGHAIPTARSRVILPHLLRLPPSSAALPRPPAADASRPRAPRASRPRPSYLRVEP